MLLRNVIVAFLDHLPSERALDLPFLALLTAMGFEDVHFTHGTAEFGKDFIAKRRDGDELVQYAFQSKAGDVGQAAWRSEVMPQMLEAATNGLGHPSFDKALPRQSVLVLSGRLVGNAPPGFQEFNDGTLAPLGKRKADCWDRERLIDEFLAHGPDSLYGTDAASIQEYGAFFSAYGAALKGELAPAEIERHSRRWRENAVGGNADKLAAIALEAELLARACHDAGRTYEALHAMFAFNRALIAAIHAKSAVSVGDAQLFRATSRRLADLAAAHLKELVTAREDAGGDLLAAIGGAAIISYPVEVARGIEAAAILYFMGNSDERQAALTALVSLANEVGAAHPVSDRHAVSLVAGVLALLAGNEAGVARSLVGRAAAWIADRYEHDGLAAFDASASEEVALLLGAPFDGVEIQPRNESLTATALVDLAALLGDGQLYADVVNDFLAVDVAFEYFQVADSVGQFLIDGEDVVQFPNVEFDEASTSFAELSYGNHLTTEPREFKLAAMLGPTIYVPLMLLLRDRYFPSVWRPIIESRKLPLPGAAASADASNAVATGVPPPGSPKKKKPGSGG